MPRLVRFYIRNVLIGFVAAAVFVALLLWLNVADLGRLVAASPDGPLAVFLLFMFNGIVFAGVQFGIAVMALGRDNGSGKGKRAPSAAALRPVSVAGPPGPSRD